MTKFFNKYYIYASLFLLHVSCAWPGIAIDDRPLGKSQISKIVKDNWQINERSIAEGIEKLVYSIHKDKNAYVTTDEIEALGASCDRLSKTCFYHGYLNYKLSGLPKENEYKAKGIIAIEVVLDAKFIPIKITAKKQDIYSEP